MALQVPCSSHGNYYAASVDEFIVLQREFEGAFSPGEASKSVRTAITELDAAPADTTPVVPAILTIIRAVRIRE